MKADKFRKDLSIVGLLKICRKSFDAFPDEKKTRSYITLTECLMSGLAIFGLKFPSLLQFDHGMDDEIIRHNLACRNKLFFTLLYAPILWLSKKGWNSLSYCVKNSALTHPL